MTNDADMILADLAAVDEQRRERAADASLAERVLMVKAYQQARFSHTYADLLVSPRYSAASRFFLDELYGPADFTRRDTQFARVVPALVRLFPREIVRTVATLSDLHALSETLDTAMARHLSHNVINAPSEYIAAWRRTGRPESRERQIALTLRVATALDSLTSNAVIRGSLRLMRGPAKAAGLSELQSFLEAGFDTFRAMHGAKEFIATVESRERRLVQALFDVSNGAVAADLLPTFER